MIHATLRGPIGIQSGALQESPGLSTETSTSLPGPLGLGLRAPLPMQVRSTRKRSGTNPNGITVHPKSEISGADWVKKIKASSHVPTHFQKQIRWRSDAIQVKNAKRFTVPNNVIPKAWRDDWLSLFLARDWEMTTAHLDITVTKGASKPIVVKMVPHLSSGDTIDGLTRHVLNEQFAKVADANITKGNTFPTGIKIDSGRRIIIIATRADMSLDGKQSTFTFNDDELIEVWFHETAAHAARNTLGLPDAHGDKTVESYAREIRDMFPTAVTAQRILKAIEAHLKP